MTKEHILKLTEAERTHLQTCAMYASGENPRRTADIQLRSKVLLAVADGLTCSEAASKFGVSTGTIHNWIRRYKYHDRESLLTEYRSYTGRVHFKPDYILSQVQNAIKRHGNNIMSLDRLSRFSGLSRSTLVRSRDIWRDLVQTPGFLRKPVKPKS